MNFSSLARTLRVPLMRVAGPQLLLLRIRRSSVASTEKKIPKRKGEYLFGAAPCLGALQAGRRRVFSIFLKTIIGSKTGDLKSTTLSEIRRYAEKRRLSIYYVSKETLKRMSGNRPHQESLSNKGMVLDVAPLNFKRMEIADCSIDTVDSLRRGHSKIPPIWLALDEIQDPMNFGAILRNAFFLGAERVIATSKNCCDLSPVVSKASSGAMELMPVYSMGNMPAFLSAALDYGWEVVGTCGADAVDQQTPVPVQDCSLYTLHKPTILVLGNEGYGVRKELSRSCTTFLTIPPLRSLPLGFDSLNVAVASGIALHRLQTSARGSEIALHTGSSTI